MGYDFFSLQVSGVITAITPEEEKWWQQCINELPLVADACDLNPFPIRISHTDCVVIDTCTSSDHVDLELVAEVVHQFFRTFRPHDYWEAQYGYTGHECGGGIVYVDANGVAIYNIEDLVDLSAVKSHLKQTARQEGSLLGLAKSRPKKEEQRA